MGSGLTYLAVRAAAEEDREEMERIKEETDKMKKLTEEFTEIDSVRSRLISHQNLP